MVKNKELVKLLKAIADENRLKIIDLLSCGPMCVCDFTEQLDLSQPNVSHHLKVLKNVGLIQTKRRGRWIDYSLNREKLDYLQQELGLVLQKCKKDCGIKTSNCDDKTPGEEL